jgi:hypothetical protein
LTTHEAEEDIAQVIARRLLVLGQMRRFPARDVQQLASLIGQLVELELHIDLDIAPDGAAQVTNRYTLLNLCDRPLSRLTQERWFKYTHSKLVLTPIDIGDQRITLQRLHDVGPLVKFACQITPPIEPGQVGVISHRCTGGLFKPEALFWRHVFPRFTRFFTMTVRHRGAGTLAGCSATEEHPDGSVTITPSALTWDYDGDDIVMTTTLDYVRPNQAVTIRWELDSEPA